MFININYFSKNQLFNKKDKQIIRDISVNVNYLETQNSFKYIGYNFEKYLDKKLHNDLNIASYENFQFSSNHLFFDGESVVYEKSTLDPVVGGLVDKSIYFAY